MFEQIYTYFTIGTIYIWLNLGILPFWLLLIFLPNSRICKLFVTSIFPFLILATIDVYLIYEIYKTGFNLFESFRLYLSLDELGNIFSEKNFIILFWIHFLAINLFCGSWIVNDSQKFNVSKFIIFFPLIITYFIGPLGILTYWIIRIFLAKRIGLFD